MIRVLKVTAVALLLAILVMTGLVAWKLHPHENPQPLPPPLISLSSTEGAERLERSTNAVDYEPLLDAYQAQVYVSYCGVASGVSVLGALGLKTDQSDFFSDEASRVRSRTSVMFGGMSLAELGGLLASHGLHVSVRHADEFGIDDFRNVVIRNLASPDDYLLVNYQRDALGQGRVGHISPLSAYDSDTDSVLIMDTAAHKYPPTWVPLDLLYAAMNTTDSSSGKMRGYIDVSRKPADR